MVKKYIIDENGIHTEEEHKSHGREHRKFEEKYTGFHQEPHKRNVKRYGPRIVETKLFISKAELVTYVNEKGQSDAIIDIFKIEDELYKLVIKK